MNKYILLVLLSISLGINNNVLFGQNLIKNASFELNPPFYTAATSWREFIEYNTTGFYSTPPSGYTFSTIANWIIISNQVDLHNAAHMSMGCPPSPGGGQHHIDVNNKGVIRQKGLTLLPDRSYILSFYTSAHALLSCAGGASAKVEISDSVTGTSVYSTTVSVSSADISKWTYNRVIFTAGKTPQAVVLDLKAVTSCLTSGYGGVLFDSLVLRDTLVNQETSIAIQNSPISDILTQNYPNPFSSSSTFRYELPGNFQTASVQIFDITGRLIKEFRLSGKAGEVVLQNGDLLPGNYTYTLNVDGENLSVKKMQVLGQ